MTDLFSQYVPLCVPEAGREGAFRGFDSVEKGYRDRICTSEGAGEGVAVE